MNNEQTTSSISETSKIMIGQKYQCTTENMVGFILFNTKTDFEMQLGPVGSENNIRKGTYTISEDKIVLTVKLDSNYMIMETGEPDPTFKEYEIRINIINNEELNYTTDFGATYTFKLGDKATEGNNSIKGNFIDEENQTFTFTEDELIAFLEQTSTYDYLDVGYEKITKENSSTYVNYITNGYKSVIVFTDNNTKKVISFGFYYFSEKNLSDYDVSWEEGVHQFKGSSALFYMLTGKKNDELSEEESMYFLQTFSPEIISNTYDKNLSFSSFSNSYLINSSFSITSRINELSSSNEQLENIDSNNNSYDNNDKNNSNNSSSNNNSDNISNNNNSDDNDKNNTMSEVPQLVGLKLSEAEKKLSNSGIYINSIYVYTNSAQKNETIMEQSIPAGTKTTGGNINLKVYKYIENIEIDIPFEIICNNFDSSKYGFEEILFNGNRVIAGYPENTVIYPNPYPVVFSSDKVINNSIKVEFYLDNKLIKSQTFNIGNLEGKEINSYGRITANKISMNITNEIN